MLHEETVEASTLALIRRLMADERLTAFYLVGGTALSLKLGHRISTDIDLFIGQDFDSTAVCEYLKADYGLTDEKTVKNGVFGFIQDIKVDFISHQYPLIKPIELNSEIRMLSLEDIGAMKLSAIVQNGSRIKDFIDIYSLLEKLPLEVLLNVYFGDMGAGISEHIGPSVSGIIGPLSTCNNSNSPLTTQLFFLT